MDYSKATDEELAQDLAAGQERALSALIGRYETQLRRYLRRRCSTCDYYGDDILQDVFMQVYRHIHDFDPGLKFSSWIYRIAHNAMVSHVRRNARHDTQASYDDTLYQSGKFRADAGAMGSELGRAMQEILQGMSETLREAFVLRFLEEKEYTEISDILRENENTVATRIRRARQQFLDEARKRDLTVYLED